MDKPGNRLVAAVIFMSSLGLLFYVINQKTLLSEVTAAYLQAVGSVAAILAAVWIDRRSAARRREELEVGELRTHALIAHLMADVVYGLDVLMIAVENGEATVISTTIADSAIATLERYPIEVIPSTLTVSFISNQIASGRHFLDAFGHWKEKIRQRDLQYEREDLYRYSDQPIAGIMKTDRQRAARMLRHAIGVWQRAARLDASEASIEKLAISMITFSARVLG
jgi:hypothetical protein